MMASEFTYVYTGNALNDCILGPPDCEGGLSVTASITLTAQLPANLDIDLVDVGGNLESYAPDVTSFAFSDGFQTISSPSSYYAFYLEFVTNGSGEIVDWWAEGTSDGSYNAIVTLYTLPGIQAGAFGPGTAYDRSENQYVGPNIWIMDENGDPGVWTLDGVPVSETQQSPVPECGTLSSLLLAGASVCGATFLRSRKVLGARKAP
jgi:hypothetical protein